jgi:endoglucanase
MEFWEKWTKKLSGKIYISFLNAIFIALLPLTMNAAGFLHTSAQDIVDENGNKTLLRGVGLGNWMLPEGYMWQFGDQADRPRKIEKIVADLAGPEYARHFWTEYRNNYITEADIKRIAELGYNSVRPALDARMFLTEGDHPAYVNAGFKVLDNLVKWSKKYGIYVIIDMHAAPGGQTGQNIDDSADNQPELFMDKKYQKRLSDLWVKIAKRYKNEATVAGYDLLNEPLPERTGAAAKYKSQLEPLYKQLAAAIRKVDKKHMIIVEGANWANDWSVFSAPFDDNMVYQFHYYCWDHPAKLKSIRQYLDYQKRFNAPVWVGETGESDDAIYWATTEYFEANNIGWSFWPWKKMAAFNGPYSIKPPKNWEAVQDYADGGAKPSMETAQKIFNELLQNIQLTNCVFRSDVVNAMFRQVPGRVDAKNYGQEGLNKSYFVNDATNNSKFYRTSEPVQIVPADANRQDSEQVVTLGAGEWTAYTINCKTSNDDYETIVRAKADGIPAEAQLMIDDLPCDVKISTNAWSEINLGTHPLSSGPHRLKWLVKDGTVQVDWFELELKPKNQLSANIDPAVRE